MPAVLVSIWRNKRRSMAMLFGIILGTVIISSVVIYTGILQKENYESVIESVAYEASFTLIEKGTENDLWALAEQIHDDERVESATIFGGIPPTSFFGSGGGGPSGGMGLRIRSEASLSAEFSFAGIPPESEAGGPEVATFFVRQNFTQTTIYQKMIGDRLDGTFVFSDTENETVLPRTAANRMNAKVGDVLDFINLTLSIRRATGQGGRTFHELSIRNVTVIGIYDPKEVEGGIFTGRLNTDTMFLNTAILYRNSNELLGKFEDEGYFFLAVKIAPEAFNLEDIDILDREISTLINDITDQSGDRVEGTNQVSILLIPFEILNTFLLLFDYILVLPTTILSTYLLIFGLLLSLEERRREIAILKVQGADTKQIFGQLRTESLVLFFIGLAVGYILSLIAAWLISSSVGFLTINLRTLGNFGQFIYFDLWAFVAACSVIGVIILVAVRKKGKGFIALEVSQAVQKMEWKRIGFLRRNKIDLAMLVYGTIALVFIMIQSVFKIETIGGVSTSFGFFIDIFLFRIIGLISFWLGGVLSGARVAKWLALKLERRFLALRPLRDVANIVRSGLKRRGDVDRLVMIIILTLSVATLGVVQGYTDEQFTVRNIEYEIGADMQVEFSLLGNQTGELEAIPGVDEVMPLPMLGGYILSTPFQVFAVDPSRATLAIWHTDSFVDLTPEAALSKLAKTGNDEVPGVFLGKDLATELGSSVGDRPRVKVPVIDFINGTSTVGFLEVKVIGLLDHGPGKISSESLLCSFETLLRLQGLIGNFTPDLAREPEALTYLMSIRNGADRSEIRKNIDQINGVSAVHDLQATIDDIGSRTNYGIPGLLTMMFVIALIASLTSAFAFSAIIIKRRNREFAVLQTIGASRTQIYKTAIGENALLMLVSVVWGTFIGLGVVYMMNDLFDFMGFILGRGELARVVFIPWWGLVIIGVLVFSGMIGAVALSARRAARQDLAIATRVL